MARSIPGVARIVISRREGDEASRSASDRAAATLLAVTFRGARLTRNGSAAAGDVQPRAAGPLSSRARVLHWELRKSGLSAGT